VRTLSIKEHHATPPGVGWLARISYSLYLGHKIALHAVDAWAVYPWQLHGWPAFILYAIGVLALGAALHYAVERPFLEWCGRLDARRLAAAMPVGAA
jgi:peptidoglycan/LPS O-acetylase OafA/YrhL